MKKSKVSLGKGLSAILGNLSNDVMSSSNKNLDNILISQVERNPFQPRNKFNQNKLDELALSIKQLGVIQPITVRKINLDKYQIISGERRYRASKIVGLENIPAYIRIANDQEMLEMALVENIQRENLNPIEIALSYKRLINECNLTQEECSLRVGKKRTTITNFMRLLKLPTEIQNGLSEGKISTGHARALINIKSKENQMNIYHDTVANYYSVREVEQIAKTFSE
jgi:ParB family chromosome partitioning protein